MSIKYYAPGERKGNKFVVAIIRARRRRAEISTRTTSKTDGKRIAQDAERQMLTEQMP